MIIVEKKNLIYKGKKFIIKIKKNFFNCYLIYDWKIEDIWVYNFRFKDKSYNKVYDFMIMVGVKLFD